MQQHRLLRTAQQGTCCYLLKVTQLMGPGTTVVFNESVFKASGQFRAFVYSTPKSFQLILINIYLSSSVINLIQTNITQGLAKCLSFYFQYLYTYYKCQILYFRPSAFQPLLLQLDDSFCSLHAQNIYRHTLQPLKGVSMYFILPLIHTILEPYTHECQVFLNVPLEGMNESHIPTPSLAL